jgi:hypothetical protein
MKMGGFTFSTVEGRRAQKEENKSQPSLLLAFAVITRPFRWMTRKKKIWHRMPVEIIILSRLPPYFSWPAKHLLYV